jgi:hypothetical protein
VPLDLRSGYTGIEIRKRLKQNEREIGYQLEVENTMPQMADR